MRATTASTSWLSRQSVWLSRLCITDLSDLRSSHAYLIRNLLSSILIMFITCPFFFCNMEFLSIHSIALWTLMFSLSRGQHLCAVAVTADGEKVAHLGGCFLQNPRKFRANRTRNRPKTLLLAGKRHERRLKMQPFANPTIQKRNLSLTIEIAAHFLRNERHYLVDVLGKPP